MNVTDLPASRPGHEQDFRHREVLLPPVGLPAILTLPEGEFGAPQGIILFAHGSGSSRLSPRNAHAAGLLRRSGFATLLFDLLSEEEAHDRAKVFEIPLLAKRLLMATEWVRSQPQIGTLPIGYFGASTGAAAALSAAAAAANPVRAVVSRGGRPDLSISDLPLVRAPTLLIVGERDPQVLELNETALAALCCERELAVIPGASHLFEERGTLDRAIALAADWFRRHLAGSNEDAPRRIAGGRS